MLLFYRGSNLVTSQRSYTSRHINLVIVVQLLLCEASGKDMLLLSFKKSYLQGPRGPTTQTKIIVTTEHRGACCEINMAKNENITKILNMYFPDRKFF